ncbi:BTAD domain-containing putative transcriptional regulator [Rhodococcus sp. NPDC003318]|uniref:BTAD domain-containing putative transcriptional regulator n=1 Tax=Rhodococcus sp. NPDC003318 TaxID=3364503 RepID=UPI0036B7BD1D
MHPDSNYLAPAASPGVEVALLGEVATRRGGDLVPLPGTRARSLLVALARTPGRMRSAQALIEDVWGDAPPKSPMNALHTQISRLRAALPDGVLESGPAGYRLDLSRAQVDLTLARALEQHAQQQHADGDHLGAVATVRRARDLWRGEPAADLPPGDLARELAEDASSRSAALDAVEIAALVAAGELRQALPLARTSAARAPLDEQAHGQLMLVLYGLGLGNEALEVFAGLRERLADRLGTDPSPRLVELNAAVLTAAPLPVARPAVTYGPETVAVQSGPTSVGLRAAPNVLLGRDSDLAGIERLLATTRVVTVLGPGGTGKTRIAHEVGLRAAQRVPVALVELASLRNGADVIAAISSTLGIGEVELAPGTTLTRARIHDARDRLQEALSARPSLLILDNCEHLVDDVAEVVADLVAASDQLTVLATSRAPMAITAEAVYPLPPLTVDESGSPATELFRARAQAVRPSVRLEPSAVARLCRTLDGLPLAIELAAARVRTMSVEEINDRLTDRFALLRSGDRTSPQRHRTLHAVIEWSWNLLEPYQRAALRRLCRFPAGFTLDAAVAVAEWDGVADAADAVEGLVTQSMLTVVEDQVGLRYLMLETVREFGEEQLALAGADEETAVTERTFDWAQRFCLGAVRRFLDGDQTTVTHVADTEHDNLLAVLRQAHGVGREDVALTLFPVLAVLWTFRGTHSEVVAWAPRILDIDPRGAAARAVPGNVLALTYVLLAGVLAFGGVSRSLALARVRLREIIRVRNDFDPVMATGATLMVLPATGRGVPRTLAVAVRHPDRASRCAALIVRANLRENGGDLYGSGVDARIALELAEAAGESWTVSMVCQHLGSLAAQSARYEEAVRYYRRGAALMQELHVLEETAAMHSYIAAALVGLGRLDEAHRELESAGPLVEVPDGPGRRDGAQSAAAVAGSRAEVDLASGDVEAGLRGYRSALGLVGWPEPGVEDNPDPFGLLVLSAAVDAHVLAGRAPEAATIVDWFTARMLEQLGPGGHRDHPQTGAVACAVGSFDIATGVDDGVRLLALATRVSPRQDFPSMRVDRHLDLARRTLGDARVEDALAAVAGIPRRRARALILEALRARE